MGLQRGHTKHKKGLTVPALSDPTRVWSEQRSWHFAKIKFQSSSKHMRVGDFLQLKKQFKKPIDFFLIFGKTIFGSV